MKDIVNKNAHCTRRRKSGIIVWHVYLRPSIHIHNVYSSPSVHIVCVFKLYLFFLNGIHPTRAKPFLLIFSSSLVVYVGANTDGADGKVMISVSRTCSLVCWFKTKQLWVEGFYLYILQILLFQKILDSFNCSIVIFEPVPSFFSSLNNLWQTYVASRGFRLNFIFISLTSMERL